MNELKQIKRHHERQLKNMDKKLTMYQIHPDDVSWLIKQAERVEELEEERDEWKDTAQFYYMTNQELREQNKRYKQALEFYAERDNYQWEVSYRPQQEIDCMVIDDSGHTARKALEELSDGHEAT